VNWKGSLDIKGSSRNHRGKLRTFIFEENSFETQRHLCFWKQFINVASH